MGAVAIGEAKINSDVTARLLLLLLLLWKQQTSFFLPEVSLRLHANWQTVGRL